jgi:SPP1 family predicted phage head-tail adaptor
MVLDSGKYRNYCVVQSATRTSDAQGGYTVEWTTLFSEWFRATPLSQSRTLDDGGVKYRKAIQFDCRYRSDYNDYTQYRIVWNSEAYTVNSCVPDERLRYLIIIAYV